MEKPVLRHDQPGRTRRGVGARTAVAPTRLVVGALAVSIVGGLALAAPASAAGNEQLVASCAAALPITHPGCGATTSGAPFVAQPGQYEEVDLVGADRWGTAVAVAQHGFPGAKVAVLVSGEDDHLVDALSAAPLARSLAAPVLLTAEGALPAATREYVVSQGFEAVLVVGGTSSVSAAVEAELTGLGVASVGRVTGDDRYATSRAVAALMPAATHAWVASGEQRHLVDALAAGGPAARLGEPVVLVPATGNVSATVAALAARGTTSTTVAGGTTAVSDDVLAQLPAPERASSVDRYATAAVVAQEGVERGVPAGDLVYPSGDVGHLVDGLAGATLGRTTLLAGDAENAFIISEGWSDAYDVVRRTRVGGAG